MWQCWNYPSRGSNHRPWHHDVWLPPIRPKSQLFHKEGISAISLKLNNFNKFFLYISLICKWAFYNTHRERLLKVIWSKQKLQRNEIKWMGFEATFVHMRAKLGQETLLRMVRWMRWPPDTGSEFIRTLAIWGRARYHSVTKVPHNIESLRMSVEERSCFFGNLKAWVGLEPAISNFPSTQL